MTDIVETLFLYAAEKNFHPYLKIEELRQSTNCCISIKEEAAFQSGLAIGLELSRL